MTPQAIVWLIVGIGMVLFVAADVSLTLTRRRVGRSADAPDDGSAALPDTLAPRMQIVHEPEPEPEPELPSYTSLSASQRNGNGNGVHPLTADEPVIATNDADDAFATPLTEVAVLDSIDADSASWVFDYHSGDGNQLNVPARSAFLLVLESIGTPRSVGAIARAATNDPELAIRAEALKALARLVEDDGSVWAGVAANAARTVISQRAKGEDDVARARDLLATVDVVLYEA